MIQAMSSDDLYDPETNSSQHKLQNDFRSTQKHLTSLNTLIIPRKLLQSAVFSESPAPFPKMGNPQPGNRQVVNPGPGLVVKSYGILGLSSKEQKADPPDEDTILVDPAGLPFIRGDKGPKDAKGAAQANYRWLEIDQADSFPEEVKNAITEECQAKYYAYADGKKKCIHVVGPDLRTSDERGYTLNEAVAKLALAYANVFEEFVTVGKQQGLTRMRLLPISGGIFSGDFKAQLPEMTARAVQFAYDRLSEDQQHYISKSSIDMCIFMDSEFQTFASAFGQQPEAPGWGLEIAIVMGVLKLGDSVRQSPWLRSKHVSKQRQILLITIKYVQT